MKEIDFMTAFGRLLRDGNLRDAFAVNPQATAMQVHLRRPDFPAWQQLVPADVEFQAEVLLRKRLDLVKQFAPDTCRQPGEKLWPIFRKYARIYWPPEGCAKILDAFQFCRHLRETTSEVVIVSEWNRLAFALSQRRAAIHWVKLPAKKKNRRGVQLFLRGPGRRWREFLFYFSL